MTLAGCVIGGALAYNFVPNQYGLFVGSLQWGGLKVGAMVVGFGQTIAGAQFIGLLSDIVDAMMALPNLRAFAASLLVTFRVICEFFDADGLS